MTSNLMGHQMGKDWHPEDIKSALRKRGITLTQIALRADVSKQIVSLTLQGRVSARCERTIAEALDIKPHVIWPSRYDETGERLYLRGLSNRERAAA